MSLATSSRIAAGEPPKSIDNSITPTVVESGDTVTWTVKVENSLDEDIVIERCVVEEKATKGWAEGLYEFIEELPITNNVVAGASTETIYERAKPVSNKGPTEIEITNTVTLYFADLWSASDTCIYRILPQ